MSFESQLRLAWPPPLWSDVTVLVAVSGGLDSTALLAGLMAVRQSGPGRLVVAHFNHRLRGDESDCDERLVVRLAERFGLECRVERVDDDLRGASPDGLEAAARDLRYGFFRRAADDFGARFVVTAHTADDQAETILHRIIRGTGLRGLAGIPKTRALSPVTAIVRPLLGIRRHELRRFLNETGQTWREDSSNAELNFTRNRIRHELLPLLETQFNPRATDAVLRLSRLAEEAQLVVESAARRLLDEAQACLSDVSLGAATERRVVLDCEALSQASSPALVREVFVTAWKRFDWPLQSMGFEQWEELRLWVDSSEAVADRDFPSGIRALKRDGRIILSRES